MIDTTSIQNTHLHSLAQMRINTIKIENFRGIRNMELSLHPQLNVFIGINGSGKSSVLDAIANTMTPIVHLCARKTRDDRSTLRDKYDFPESDITLGCQKSLLRVEVSSEKDGNVSWKVKSLRFPFSEKQGKEQSCTEFLYDNEQELFRFLADSQEAGGWTSLVYYRTNRYVKEVPLKAWMDRNFSIQDAYLDAFSETTNFHEFFEWFRNREDLENEEKANDVSTEEKQISAVREALSAFLGPVMEWVRVFRRDPLRMIAKKRDEELRIEQLSDGEKCLLAMVGDIARRLAIAHPESHEPLKGEGIVLIDEVDLHLHPQWQRTILPKLMETFPNCQFIVSTHSPQILGEVRSEHVFILHNGENGVEVTPPAYETFGQTSDVVLADILDTPHRNREVENKIDAILREIDAGHITEAHLLKAELEKIARSIPEHARIDMLLHRRELLGK